MKKINSITTLFLDIGGVLLTDGWGHKSRRLAAKEFAINLQEMETRHDQTFDIYELDKLTLEEYLNRVIFYEKRKFTRAQFKKFIFAQSQPYPKMLELIPKLKKQYNLKIVVVSNEARELNDYRIKKFKLNQFVDYFISSCYVKLRKPDPEIFKLALDTAQVPAENILYIENTPMFIEIAESLNIHGIYHTDYESTLKKLVSFDMEIRI